MRDDREGRFALLYITRVDFETKLQWRISAPLNKLPRGVQPGILRDDLARVCPELWMIIKTTSKPMRDLGNGKAVKESQRGEDVAKGSYRERDEGVLVVALAYSVRPAKVIDELTQAVLDEPSCCNRAVRACQSVAKDRARMDENIRMPTCLEFIGISRRHSF